MIHIKLGYALNLNTPDNEDIKFAESDPYEKTPSSRGLRVYWHGLFLCATDNKTMEATLFFFTKYSC